MIYTLEGKVSEIGETFFVLQAGAIGYKVFTNKKTLASLAGNGDLKLYCFLYIREEQMELYGFLDEAALKLFEMLNTVAGVGPKTALGILDVETVPGICAAIIEKRADVLTHASGIGQKTAERIILELNTKIKLPGAKALTKTMDINLEVEEALVGLGYSRGQVKKVFEALKSEPASVEERLREALRALGKTK